MKVVLFQIPYWRYKIKGWPKVKKSLHALIKRYPCVAFKNQNFLTNRQMGPEASTTFIHDLLNILSDPFQQFVQEVKTDLKITGAWATRYEKGMDQWVHTHPEALFVGMIYLDFDPKIHQATMFKQPYGQLETNGVAYTSPGKAAEGEMFFFPSNIEHFAPVNKSSTPRTILAMDLNFHV
ncbi:MAG TPA: hypothetical protein DCS66_06180 [Flavobacteriaceae bacterium]|nr:hypothetical protein [Flavobacteriaceae bacterium]